MSDGIVEHLRTIAGSLDDAQLPPHHPTCLGCGPDSPQGFHLAVRREGDEVVTQHVFGSRHSGAPGIAHGGAVATVVDDLLGYLLYVARVPGVTRHLEVGYRRPVLVGVPYTVRGRIDSRDGRKLWMSCTGTSPAGEETFSGRALFLAVDLSHFDAARADVAGGGPGAVTP